MIIYVRVCGVGGLEVLLFLCLLILVSIVLL